MARILNYIIEDEYDGKRVIAYLRGKLSFSARLVTKLKKIPNSILLDGVHVRTIDPLKSGSMLSVTFPEETMEIEPVEYELDIVYADEDILIINKPAGIAMHPTHNHQGDTLANAVSWYLSSQGKSNVFRSIGRLDKGTSGLVLCALNRYAASRLTGNIAKTYLALAGGCFSGEGVIDSPIIRPDPMKTLRWIGEGGERALTRWTGLKSSAKHEASLVHVVLETGRTHQIRVHFASLGTPLLGDDMYGGDTSLINRPALHCYTMEFFHPVTNIKMCFEQEMPFDMKKNTEFLFAEA